MHEAVLARYLTRFAHLRTDTSPARWSADTRHHAPHKPLLLFAVLDQFSECSDRPNLIEMTPELGELFALYWSRVLPPEHYGNLALPFFHLRSDGFWHLLPRPGKDDILAAVHHVKSTTELDSLILGARLDDDLYRLLQDQGAREALRAVLLDTYFITNVQPRLFEQAAINLEAFRYSQILLEQARGHAECGVVEPERPAARDQGFRRAITLAYDHRCTFCGIRVVTADGHTAVDAAHIKPWNVSRDDDPRNGLALCRLCHWTFDEGLLGVSSRYQVLVSPQMGIRQNVPGHLLTLDGRGIIGPVEQNLWPRLDALGWHREHIFRPR